MEGFLHRGTSLEYTVYKTLANLNRRLGNKQLAEEQQKNYDTQMEIERKKFEEFFKTDK